MKADRVLFQMSAAAARCQAKRLCLFGSRARGDFRPGSDYNFAVWGIPEEERPSLLAAAGEIPTLLRLNVVFVSGDTSPALWESIRKDGVVLMDRFQLKYDSFRQALTRLQEGLAQYEQCPGALAADGVLFRFSYTCGLAWDTAREYLMDQGYWELNNPKAVMRQALAEGLISDGDGWLSLLEDYERVSQACGGAAEILRSIQDVYMDLLTALAKKTEKTE